MSPIPTTANRTVLAKTLEKALKEELKNLHLGANEDFHAERRKHSQFLGIQNIPGGLDTPIAGVEFTAIRGPHGVIPLRCLHPTTHNGGALVYMHGGGYTVGTGDEFERGLRIVAEESNTQVFIVDYRLAPEWQYPTQLDEFEAVIAWLQGEGGEQRGVDHDKVVGGGDSAGGNMTAALALRLKDQKKQNMAGQLLLYPEARVPFDTKACEENNTGYYLEANGIFSFADHYLPRGVPPSTRYVSPGMQSPASLRDQPPAMVYTCGFDPLRDVGVEYAHKLQEAGNKVEWIHHPDLTHGFIQFGYWSEECEEATRGVARGLKKLVEGDL
ncbi:hypothetical protein I302_107970 [Kwoniella bestiolae CBS 10118]|uniref:Alpha/beta hydrolase fold-3 domain-containing protein n=1 Tax=Kwoniella bestiolae CBS 10118 TaxID=1296100 RepID=A0A1B9FX14_9TREE|nr:hypothetical protein I302_07666 [Kwoniella bestiolae CBS 10118]OCF23312.1 hypothetical protein I302_07666 [Kwoniella bestiolae CBS 10118]